VEGRTKRAVHGRFKIPRESPGRLEKFRSKNEQHGWWAFRAGMPCGAVRGPEAGEGGAWAIRERAARFVFVESFDVRF